MKRVEKSPYAARPSMTMPIHRPKNILKDKPIKMPVEDVRPKREGNSRGSGEKQNGRDQQESQVLSGRETIGTKTCEGDIVHTSQVTEMCSVEINQAKSETNSEDSKRHGTVVLEKETEIEKVEIRKDTTQTKNEDIASSEKFEEEPNGDFKSSGVNSRVNNESLVSSTANINGHLEKKKVGRKEPSLSEICAEHNETLIIFCKDCKLPVCTECIRTTHKEHEWIQLQKAGKLMRQKLAEHRKDIVKTHLPNFMTCLEKARIEKETVQRQRKDKMEEIIAQRNEMISAVTGLSQVMLDSCNEDLKINDGIITQMEKDVAELETVASKLQESTLNCASDIEAIQMEIRLSSILQKTVPTNVTFNTNINFISGEIDIDQLENMLGKLTGFEHEQKADDTLANSDVAKSTPRSPRRPIRPLNDFQKCVQCKRMVKNFIKVKYMCGHKICNFCWFATMNSSRCPHCNSL